MKYVEKVIRLIEQKIVVLLKINIISFKTIP